MHIDINMHKKEIIILNLKSALKRLFKICYFIPHTYFILQDNFISLEKL